jgi:predicted membrane protein
MPLLSQNYAAIAGVLVIIIIGIVIEKRRVVWENVFGNVLSFILVMTTVDMSYTLAVGFSAYLILGIIVAYCKVKSLYFLFGFKTYGALSLTVLLAAYSYWGLSIAVPTFDNLFRFLGVWALLAVVIHLIGFLYTKR